MSQQSAANPRDLPPDVALFVVDIVGYSKIHETEMPKLRSALDDALAESFDRSGLSDEWADRTTARDTGDGWIKIVPAARVAQLVDPGIALLEEALHRHHWQRRASVPALRTRVSVHLGPLSADYRGDAINDACRLVDSDAVRAAAEVAAVHESFTAAILSDEVYRRVVAARRTVHLSERDFLEVSATVRQKQFSRTAWVHVPRLSPALLTAGEPEPDPAPVTPAPPSAGGTFHIAGNVGTAVNSIGTMTVGDINFA
ncbi:hypothetical protein ABZW10_33555 [Kitasatospora sp. NPDC004723]|uniref:hypothetical protein n=1 Tax=Kitasatospora sp. NPDC004723 TaxID=3154288 RepID=UPI0033A95506